MPVGFIDLNDRWIIQPEYEWVRGFRGGASVVGVPERGIAIIDRSNHFVLPPQGAKFSSLRVSRCGTRIICGIGTSPQRTYGACDLHGKMIIPFKYKNIRNEWGEERLFCCKLAETQNLPERAGIIDFDGNVVVDFDLEHIAPFSSGCAEVKFAGNKQTSFIDHQGKIVFHDPKVWILSRVYQNLFLANVKLPGDDQWSSCLLNLKGDIVLKANGEYVPINHHNGQAVVIDSKTEKRGVVNLTGNWIIPPEYDSINAYRGHTSMFLVTRNPHTPEQETMLLNPLGKPMFKRWYRQLLWARTSDNGSDVGFLLAIDKNGLHGAIDYRENVVLKFKKRKLCHVGLGYLEGLLPCEVD